MSFYFLTVDVAQGQNMTFGRTPHSPLDSVLHRGKINLWKQISMTKYKPHLQTLNGDAEGDDPEVPCPEHRSLAYQNFSH